MCNCYSKCSFTELSLNSFSVNSVSLLRARLTDFTTSICMCPSFLCRIVMDMDTLFISNVMLEDQGVYTCVASTSLDSVTAKTRLIVLGKQIFSWCAYRLVQY